MRGRTCSPNWVIRWVLYHVCRYRDARNKKAQGRNFHDDDGLDPPASGELWPPWSAMNTDADMSEGSSSGGGSGGRGPKPQATFYDTARMGYREARTSR